MIIGVDFDNTLACYDAIFHRVACERGLVPDGLRATKKAVRDYLREKSRETEWTELQGIVYGQRMSEADLFPGVRDFFRACRGKGIEVKIISHKTPYPLVGQRVDLHAAASRWLESMGFFDPEDLALPRHAVFFEPTQEAKLHRIAAAGCSVFIDDLPEFLGHAGFPPGVRRILFDPAGASETIPVAERAADWAKIAGIVLGAAEKAALPDGAIEFLGRLGWHRVSGTQSSGGGNNRVYDVRESGGRRLLLKHYFQDAQGRRNRFESERLFYGYCAAAAPDGTPEALGWEESKRLAVFQFVEGRKPAAEGVGLAEVEEALSFFTALNARRRSPGTVALPEAAEACFTSDEHMRTVARRIERLNRIAGAGTIENEARRFVATELIPAWEEIRDGLGAASGKEALAEDERCLSPSDFGFHNSLRRLDGKLVFFDFEYAGWDDPAKTVCDFFCQPALPVPARFFEHFVEGVAAALSMPDSGEFSRRCHLLLPVYRLKWCCILLNEFVAIENDRRAFALGQDRADERKAGQLAAARRMLAASEAMRL
jgi:hypothetical protein